MALKDVIKEKRLKNNLKQENAAKLIGVTVQTYSKWENGKTEPKASQIAKLSKILKISTNEICNGEENKKIELIEFMKIISEISKGVSDFELKMAIWESISNDYLFIENLRGYSNIPAHHLTTEESLSTVLYKNDIEINPDHYDEEIEKHIALKEHEEKLKEDEDEDEDEMEFIKGLSDKDSKIYESILNRYKEK